MLWTFIGRIRLPDRVRVDTQGDGTGLFSKVAWSDMQVSVTNSDGLKRTLRIVIDQGELGERFATRLDEVRGTIQLKGFRRGKVPAAHLRKLYGRSLMAEVVQQAVDETTQKVITERNERPALQPKIEFPEE